MTNTTIRPKRETQSMIGAYMSEDLVRRLDAICFATGYNRSEVLRELVSTATVYVPMDDDGKKPKPPVITIPQLRASALV